MDPSLLLAVLAPVLVLIAVGVIVGIVLARGARREAVRTRHALDEVLGDRTEARAPSPAPSSGDARKDRQDRQDHANGVDPRALGAVQDDVRALQGRLDEQAERLAAQERRLAAQEGGLARLAAEVGALAEVVPAPPEPPAPEPEAAPPPSPREILHRHAREEGWEEVAILEDPADPDAFVVEARRGGMLHKGRAYVRPGGRVEADLVPAVRAFP